MSHPAHDRPDSRLGLAGEALGHGLPALMIAALRVAETVAAGAHGRRRVGLGESFWQFRPYQPGDPVDRIDWRQSAKGDRLFIREREWAAAQTAFLWRDAGPGMAYASDPALPTKRARAELILVALAALLLRGGERVALLGSDRRPASGRAALHPILDALGTEQALHAIARPATRHATLVLIGDFLDPVDRLAADLDRLAGSGVAAILLQLLDPAEARFPFRGRVHYREMIDRPGGADDVLLPRSEAVRDAYLERLAAQQEALRGLARARGWDLLTHHTDEPPETPLRQLHQRLAERVTDAAGAAR